VDGDLSGCHAHRDKWTWLDETQLGTTNSDDFTPSDFQTQWVGFALALEALNS
jgi:hypothetical protein